MSDSDNDRRAVGIDVGSRNLSICCLSKRDGLQLWRLVDVHEAFHVKRGTSLPAKPTIAQQTEATIHALEALLTDLQTFAPTRILIEGQPVGRNAKTSNTPMKCLQHVIQAWFVLRFPEAGIDHVAASTKLGKDAPKDYSARKKLAVKIVREYLYEAEGLGNKWLQMLNDSKKADDLSDSYLICYNYIKAEEEPAKKKRKRKE